MKIEFNEKEIETLKKFSAFDSKKICGQILQMAMESHLNDDDVEVITNYILTADRVHKAIMKQPITPF